MKVLKLNILCALVIVCFSNVQGQENQQHADSREQLGSSASNVFEDLLPVESDDDDVDGLIIYNPRFGELDFFEEEAEEASVEIENDGDAQVEDVSQDTEDEESDGQFFKRRIICSLRNPFFTNKRKDRENE